MDAGSPVAHSLREARASTERAAELSRQMLAYSGKGSFVIEAVDVNAVVTEIGNLLEVSVSKNVALSYDLCRHLPPVVADVTQLHQVVLNLITNASDSIGEEGGVVALRTGREELRQGVSERDVRGRPPPGGRLPVPGGP